MSVEIFKKWLEEKKKDLLEKLEKNDMFSVNDEIINLIKSVTETDIIKKIESSENNENLSSLFSLLDDYNNHRKNMYLEEIIVFINNIFKKLCKNSNKEIYMCNKEFIYNKNNVHFYESINKLTEFIEELIKSNKTKFLEYESELKSYSNRINKQNETLKAIHKIILEHIKEHNNKLIYQIQDKLDNFYNILKTNLDEFENLSENISKLPSEFKQLNETKTELTDFKLFEPFLIKLKYNVNKYQPLCSELIYNMGFLIGYFDGIFSDTENIQLRPVIDLLLLDFYPLAKMYNYNIFATANGQTYFRGQSDASWKLQPSIYRKGSLVKNEHKMFRELILQKPEEFQNYKTALEKLVKMQHYESATRLLDITRNPLIALYFACCEVSVKNKNAILYIFTVDEDYVSYFDSDKISILSNLAKIEKDFTSEIRSDIQNFTPKISSEIQSFTPKLLNDIKTFNENPQIHELIHQIKEEKPYFESRIVPNDLTKTIFVKAKMDNQRIIRQNGAFIIYGIGDSNENHAKLTNCQVKQVIVKHEDKQRILEMLDVLGINEAYLFPELDKLAHYVKGKY